MEWIEGRELTKSMLRENYQLLKQLEKRILAVHKAGVTHNDIRMRNILIDNNGMLHVIDFAGSVLRSSRFNFLNNSIYRFFRFSDRVKLVRLKQQFSPEPLLEKDQRLFRYTKLFKSISRFWKKYFYSWLKTKT